jgi:hypothetical protein
MKPYSQSLPSGQLIPLQPLMRFAHPPNELVDTFYNESERLVRFLISSDKARFLILLEGLTGNESFDNVFPRVYAGMFANRNDFEEKFGEYATRDYSTTK